MILIDEILDGGDGWVAAAVRVGEDTLFYQPGLGVPAWVGIEYMAQTVALYSGICAKQSGKDIRLGFLLGTRRYHTATNFFRLGCLLKISVHEVWQDGNMAVFDCQICYHEDAQPVAEARLNVFSPEDSVAFLREQA
jgi:predicted hotdog family 3-hydroxylacyl-ACP dehydratase